LDQFILNRQESIDPFRSTSPESAKPSSIPVAIADSDRTGRTLVS
jgi:hypothetical protein